MKIFSIAFLCFSMALFSIHGEEEKCSNSLCDYNRKEQKLLPLAKKFFSRSGGSLDLKPLNGKAKKWVDQNASANADEVVFYRLTDFYPDQKWAVLSKQFNEGGGEFLVSLDTGESFDFIGFHQLLIGTPPLIVDKYEDYESHYNPNTARTLFCDPKAKTLCKVIKDFKDYAGVSASRLSDGKIEWVLSKSSDTEHHKKDAHMYSADYFKSVCKCTDKACECSKPVYFKTEGY